jgi:putative transposase
MKSQPTTIHKSVVAEEINAAHVLLKKIEKFGVEVVAESEKRSASSLWELKRRADAGEPLFDRRHLNPGAASAVDKIRIGWTLAFLSSRQGVPLAVACRELNKVALQEEWPATDYFALRRAIEKLPQDLRTLLAEGSRAVFEKSALVGKREQDRPLELVQMDASEMPIWTIHPATGLLIKPWMTGVIDGFSRVVPWIEFHLAEPNALDAVAALTGAFTPKDDATLPFFGIPEVVQTDNAQAYIGKLVDSVAVRAGFIHECVPIKSPSANGKIERFFQTFQDRLLSRLDGYASQTSGKKKAENRRVVPWEVLKAISRKFLLEYHSSVHSEIGMTPWEAWHEHIANAPGYLVRPSEIRKRMRVDIECEVARQGVTVLGSAYSGKVLVGLVGRKISVLTSASGGDQSVDAYLDSVFIGKLTPTPFDTDEINKARLKRQIGLSDFRKKMKASLDACPPVGAPETVVPAAERKRIKASQKQPKRKGRIRPVKFEVESTEETKR